MNLMKEVKDLYSENYKTLMKTTEDDTKILHADGLGEQIFFKSIYHAMQSTHLIL